jgi:hypothetical protein
MKKFSFLLALTLALPGLAYVNKNEADQRYPTQAAMEMQVITTPLAASATRLSSSIAGPTSASPVTVTTFSAQPDVPRNIVITTGGTTADIAAGTAVVTGTNYFGRTISENFTITAAQNGATTGSKAFKTVTSVVLPGEQGGFAGTWSIGTGVKLGLKRCMDQPGYLDWATVQGAYETTYPTVAASATAVESNTVTTNTAPNGSKDIAFFFVQNFRCLP